MWYLVYEKSNRRSDCTFRRIAEKASKKKRIVFKIRNKQPSVKFSLQILILENLNLKGYVMKSAIQLDYSHASLALQKLGEFHSYSFLTRVTNPTSFEKLKVKEHFLTKEPPSEKMSFYRDLVVNIAIEVLFVVLSISNWKKKQRDDTLPDMF